MMLHHSSLILAAILLAPLHTNASLRGNHINAHVRSASEQSATENNFKVDVLPGEVPHRSNRHLFEFSGDCTDSDYAATPYYVSPTGNNWDSANGWGLSPSKPFKTIQHAVDNRMDCQTIYIMEGTYLNNYYGQSQNHANKVVNLNGVSNLKLLADPNATTKPILKFDGPGGIFGGSATNPISNIEIAGLEIVGPNESITYDDAMSNRLIKRTYYTGRGIAIWSGHHVYIHDMEVHHCPASGNV